MKFHHLINIKTKNELRSSESSSSWNDIVIPNGNFSFIYEIYSNLKHLQNS